MRFPRWGLATCVGLIGLVGSLLPCALRAQSYGPDEQVLTIGAASFRGTNNQPVFQSDGYLYNADPNDSNGSIYLAPFRLPDGALVTRLCASLRNAEAAPSVALVGLQAVRVAPGGPNGTFSISFINPSFNSGYAEFCTGELSYTFRDDRDVDADGDSDHVTHRLTLILPEGATVGFGGARLSWRRQITPPPAQSAFGDVPADHPFFQYIEALSASAITGGCGNGNFCPDAPLTRGQMAVFLAKALGLHWAN